MSEWQIQPDKDSAASSPPNEMTFTSGAQANAEAPVAELVDAVQTSLIQLRKDMESVKKLADEVADQAQDIRDQRETTRHVQAVLVLGFVLTLLTVVVVVMAAWTVIQDSSKQINDQSVLLQQIQDKLR